MLVGLGHMIHSLFVVIMIVAVSRLLDSPYVVIFAGALIYVAIGPIRAFYRKFFAKEPVQSHAKEEAADAG